MAVMCVWTYYPRSIAKYIVWLAYIQSAIRTAVEGWHYSVDFILPAALGWFVWHNIDWTCPARDMLPLRGAKSKDPVSTVAVVAVLAALAFSILNAFYLGA
jgi:hypothetical protein